MWRWRLVAENGKVISDSAEGYHNKLDCQGELVAIITWLTKMLGTVKSADELMKQIIGEEEKETGKIPT
jgi:hypothetical protein